VKSANRSNALLVELLIVVLFFMLSATVLLQVFSTARSQSSLAGKLILASNAAQDVSDRLYGAKDAESALKEMGWTQENGLWRLPGGDYDLTVSFTREQQPFGELLRYQVRAVSGEDTLIDLPGARYQEAAE
jgi:hypothetical protein